MDYDGSYHLLFANPKMVEDLLDHFIEEPWVEQLNFSTLKRYNSKFHSEAFDRRESDIIYSINLDGGEEVFLYLLLEFQSSQDKWMSLRISIYVQLFWQQLIKEKRLNSTGKLPPVFPLVLYNGSRQWKAPRELGQLIDLPEKSLLWPWQPQMRYYLIDESQYPDGKPGSILGLLFEIENCRDQDKFLSLITLMSTLVSGDENAELRKSFSAVLTHALAPAVGLDKKIDLSSLENTEMLAENVKRWEKELREKGRLEGKLEGRFEGSLETSRFMLINMLHARFNNVPERMIRMVDAADTETIQAWAVNLVNAETLDDIFKS